MQTKCAPTDRLADEDPVLVALTVVSVRGTIAIGVRAGQRLRHALKDQATGVRTGTLVFCLARLFAVCWMRLRLLRVQNAVVG